MEFVKMHGIGNDYIYIECMEKSIENPNEISKRISDRHFGIGGDGLVLILPSEIADFKMKIFNSDGSEAEMCGNAIRCVGKYVYDKGLTDKKQLKVETLAGIKILQLMIKDGLVETVEVDMGEPILKPEQIPVNSSKPQFINELLTIDNENFYVTCISMGNPHAVIYVDDVDSLKLNEIGLLIENHPTFPKKINVEFVQVISDRLIKMRVWERGAGETLACGTGASAAVVSSVLNNKTQRQVTVKLLGGELLINWNGENNHVYMTGPAEFVFEGRIDI